MRIINIVDNLSRVNFGIWNAAISTAEILNDVHGVESECWFPSSPNNSPLPSYIQGVPLGGTSISKLLHILSQRELTPDNCVIVTHGSWQFPTRWGHHLAQMGFKWIYVPHGMLEPWSMKQKWLKKLLYFNIYEKKMVQKATIVRAVGKPEYMNLLVHFPNVVHLPNGVAIHPLSPKKKETMPQQFLFMARIHPKKGIIPLTEAWMKSPLANHTQYELIIAGPDDGALSDLMTILMQHSVFNIRYVGPKYGNEKLQLLQSAQFYILPSLSEGFPTSILEAMQDGLIPIISEGCNFPEVFEKGLAISIAPEVDSIVEGLKKAIQLSRLQQNEWSKRSAEFIEANYSTERIAQLQMDLLMKLFETENFYAS